MHLVPVPAALSPLVTACWNMKADVRCVNGELLLYRKTLHNFSSLQSLHVCNVSLSAA
jgi:hypothetical protein